MADYEKQIEELANEEQLEEDVLSLIGDDGEEVNFFHLATLEHNKEWFVVLQPTADSQDATADELVIMQLATDDKEDDVFLPIEDEDVLNAVYDEYVKLAEAEEAFEEAQECSCGCGCHDHEEDHECGCDHEEEHECSCGCHK